MRKRAIVVGLAYIIILLGLMFWLGFEVGKVEPRSTTFRVTIPACQEDEPYLVGSGDFDGDTWEHYSCVHIDAVTLHR